MINKKYGIGGKIDSDAPAVYFSTYDLYTNNRLDGEWLDLSQFESGEEVMRYINRKLKVWAKTYHTSPEEPMFQDYQNIPETLYNESMVEEDFDKIYAALKAAEEKDLPISVINDIIREYDPNDLEEWIDDRYDGQFESDEQLGEHYVEMTGGIENMDKDTLERYFDYERFGRDLAYDYSEFDGYYFRSYKKGGLLSKKRKSGKVDAKAYERLAEKVAAYYVGKPVPKKYQSKYGTTYDKKEARSVGFAVATKVLGQPKYSKGGNTNKTYKMTNDTYVNIFLSRDFNEKRSSHGLRFFQHLPSGVFITYDPKGYQTRVIITKDEKSIYEGDSIRDVKNALDKYGLVQTKEGIESDRNKFNAGGLVRKQEWIAIFQHQNMQRVIVVYANTQREAIREAEMSRNSNGIGKEYQLVDIYTYSGNLPIDIE